MNIWTNILNYPLIDTAGFIFAPINIIIFLVIYLIGKLFLKYLKRYFKVLHIDDKQFTIEGREFALWKLIRQFVYFLMFYISFRSLKFNNQEINFSNVFEFDFIRMGEFHISVYHLFLVIVVLFVSKMILNFLKVYLLKRVSKRNNLDKGTEYTIIQIAKYVIYTIAIIIILRSFGVQLSLFLGGATAFLLAVGLGLQDIFKDFISGLLLLFEGTTKVGDVVEIGNTNYNENAVATITEINLRTSKVKTREGKTLILPNSILTHQLVNNWSYDDTLTRFNIPVAVAYDSDMDLVKEILIKCASEHPKVKNTKPVFVMLLGFGDFGLEMELVFWADQNFEIEKYKSEIRFTIVKEFRTHNVEIPYPQQDIHLKSGNFGE